MDQLLQFMKVLADGTRLKIVGLLAIEPHSVEQLAAALSLGAPTISHHLSRMQKVGLVHATAQQYYNVYFLDEEALARFVAQLSPNSLGNEVEMSDSIDRQKYSKQILDKWILEQRLTGLPTQIKQRQIILNWLTGRFESNVRYDEDQVWDQLRANCTAEVIDYTPLYRALVDDGLLGRVNDGSWYWRADSTILSDDPAADFRELPIATTPDINRYTPRRAAMKARDPEGDYASLAEEGSALSRRQQLARLALRIKRGQPYEAEELDTVLTAYSTEDPAMLRRDLVACELLEQRDDQTYWRPPRPSN